MLEARIRHETNELRLLFEISQALDGVGELSAHLEAALALLARYTAMQQGLVELTMPDSAEAEVEVLTGFACSPPSRIRTLTARTIASGKPAATLFSGESLAFPFPPAAGPAKEEISHLAVPILLSGRPVGSLTADRLFADSVGLEEDFRLLSIVASLMARAAQTRRELRAMHALVIDENRRLQEMLQENFSAGSLVGSSAAMRSLLREAAQVAGSNATVLIRGESGSGKELVADIIHSNSPRAGRPLVKVNCAALPEGLVESELFGHERGAFTGAVGEKKGRFELAQGGTIFLDEVGEMSQATQAKLLRVLQEKTFERVGGGRTIRVNVRVVAATNRDLEAMVAQGSFRQDLYYRLSVFPLHLPPLRERKDDIPTLVTHFIDVYSRESGRPVDLVTPQAMDLLRGHDWPGNVRELENVIERAIILCGPDGVIDVSHLPAWLRRPQEGGQAGQTLAEAVADLERRMIRQALEAEQGHMGRAAGRLGITERIIGLRARTYGIDYKEFRKT